MVDGSITEVSEVSPLEKATPIDETPSAISIEVTPELTAEIVVTLYVRLLYLTEAGMETLPLGVFITVALFVAETSEYVIPSMV